MNIVTDIAAWRDIRAKLAEKSVGLVHTMGNLHAGHGSLFIRALGENDVTVAAIFVNPKQFNQAQDFALYPRTLEQDKAYLESMGVDYLLLFDEPALYPDDYHVQVSEHAIANELEGAHRPGHFTGMLTIVLKFLNIVQPTKSYYGEKDYQQLLLIQAMARALFLPVDIIGCETVRAEDGLALSSRNSRLTSEMREKAKHFPALLQSTSTPDEIQQALIEQGFQVDYIAEKWGRRLGAVWLDGVRLIDNVII